VAGGHRRIHLPPRLPGDPDPAAGGAVSLVGTFMVFPLLGFSINTLSLFGLVLAIGLVVDDAIVVVEAVEHHIERGLSPRDAALRAMHEVSAPVVAIALSWPPCSCRRRSSRVSPGGCTSSSRSPSPSPSSSRPSTRLTLSPAPLGAAPAAEARDARPARVVLPWLQPRLRAGDGRVSRRESLPDPARPPSRYSYCSSWRRVGPHRHPASRWFRPEEDQGYFYVNAQLPPAASLERTAGVMTSSTPSSRTRRASSTTRAWAASAC